ncbi:MAG TPA: hypothetical protein PLN93_03675 [Vicinamibacterales bacterium]|nr:hypothetical protein [Vicinamibacterales bacterium]HOQ61793.1 hypothetical protein [Vicinamibacterales bacterium]HPK71020.1 hypothetical protein [Vicinamibacterales bacterium]
MAGAPPSVALPQIAALPDARLGRYRSIVVGVIVGAILALTSLPAVTLPLW